MSSKLLLTVLQAAAHARPTASALRRHFMLPILVVN
jgi:hypothetical protein